MRRRRAGQAAAPTRAGVAQPGRRTGLRNRLMRVRIPPPALRPTTRPRSSADSERRASNPGAEVRLLSGALRHVIAPRVLREVPEQSARLLARQQRVVL